MSEHDSPPDPFSAFESDRTIIKPSAGRATRAGGQVSPSPKSIADSGFLPLGPTVGQLPELPVTEGFNPLLQAGAALLLMAPRLRGMARHADPRGLRTSLIEAINRFESSARLAGLPNEQVIGARYILCTMLDEAASSTPWGGSGAWSAQSLLVHFHNESWGGEKVFQLLSKLAASPAQNRNLLEFLNATLALGFEGRYGVAEKGRDQLNSIRERLAAILRDGTVSAELSTQWQGVAPTQKRLRDGIPLWVVGSVVAVLLMVVFVFVRLDLNVKTDPTFSGLQNLAANLQKAEATPVPVAKPSNPPPPRLSQFLATDISARRVEVSDLVNKSTVTIQGDGMFGAGSEKVREEDKPLLNRIGLALAKIPGSVVINGHTDSIPIRSLQFPSNWHLSKARALSVRDLIARNIDPARIRVEGLADTEPLADNGTPAGRARNRRVEIILTPSASNDSGANQ